MTDRVRRRLHLELEDSHGDSIAGRLSNEAGEATEFTGWIGLAGALEDALHGAPADDITAQGGEPEGHVAGRPDCD